MDMQQEKEGGRRATGSRLATHCISIHITTVRTLTCGHLEEEEEKGEEDGR